MHQQDNALGEATERTSLLPKDVHENDVEGQVGDVLDEDKTPGYRLVLHEFWILLKGSVPVILAYTLQNSLQTFSVLIVGRASPQDLSTAAFSYVSTLAFE
jgi:multidrug resistance protein, MATE family